MWVIKNAVEFELSQSRSMSYKIIISNPKYA